MRNLPKCKLPTCNNAVNRANNEYCSPRCYQDSKVVYTPQVLSYVQAHIITDGYDAVCIHLNITKQALVRQITTWRNNGVPIPYQRKVPIGTVRYRIREGIHRRFIKTVDGWKCEALPKPPKPVKPPKMVKAKSRPTGRPSRPPKRIDLIPTVVRDATLYRMVKIDNRTWREVLITG